MAYYFSTTLHNYNLTEAIERVSEVLKTQGFGVLFDLDISATLKKKLEVDFKPYHILGACHPGFAHEALLNEEKVGVFLPCNVIVVDQGDGDIEVSAVDPIASMQSIENPALEPLAEEVREKLRKVIEDLSVNDTRMSVVY